MFGKACTGGTLRKRTTADASPRQLVRRMTAFARPDASLCTRINARPRPQGRSPAAHPARRVAARFWWAHCAATMASWTSCGALLVLAGSALLISDRARAQELEPRAYSPSPVGVNVFTVSDSFSTGSLTFDPSVPITNASANVNVAVASYLRTLDVFGRSANIGVALPYARGNVNGDVYGRFIEAHRSAWGDPAFRFAVNLYGAPAMTPREFATFRPGTIVGASLVVVAPLGAYDSTKLVNVGSNRWAFRPEVGVSHPFGRWTLEGDLAGWFFTDNTNFFGGNVRSQAPISSVQFHAIYTFKPRMWIAFDSNFYNGGRTTINGRQNFDLLQNSRIGVTFALPITPHQALRFAVTDGARTSIGGNFRTFGVAYQYNWSARP